jgi:hypothetical protein
MTVTTVAFPAALTVDLAAEQPAARRTIAGTAVPLGVPSGPSTDGSRYLFAGPPSNPDDLLDVVRGHDDDYVVGRLAAPLAAGDGVLTAAARIFGTTRGDDVLVEATEGVLTGFSVSADIETFDVDADGLRTVTAWTARHLGVVRRPAFQESAGLRVAAAAVTTTTERTPAVTTTTVDPTVQQLPTIAELAAEVTRAMAANTPTPPVHPLAQFASYAEYIRAVFEADVDEARGLQAAFAVADQTTTDNPGVIPPGWRSDIQMNLITDRPAIDGTGGSIALPPSGMDSSWPYFDGDITGIIARQVAEKTDLSGPKISIKKATQPILTAGVVSDISYQLLMRSSPSYLEAYMSICRAAWGQYTEAVFEDALETAATVAAAPPDWSDIDAVVGWLFAQSAAVKRATGSPASVVGVSSAVWLQLGAFGTKLPNPVYGTQNVSGTSSASELSVNLNGLAITEWPYLDDVDVIVTNRRAARFAETGAMTVSAEDPRKLGRDVAVWGMYEPAEIYFPAGVISGTSAVAPAAARSAKK